MFTASELDDDELLDVVVLELEFDELLDVSLDEEPPHPASIDAAIAPVKSNASCFFIFTIMKTLPLI
jgi:hypothetical protein